VARATGYHPAGPPGLAPPHASVRGDGLAPMGERAVCGGERGHLFRGGNIALGPHVGTISSEEHTRLRGLPGAEKLGSRPPTGYSGGVMDTIAARGAWTGPSHQRHGMGETKQ